MSKMKQRIGCQEPSVHFVLPYNVTRGGDAVKLYEASRRMAFEWQQSMIDDILAVGKDGLWVHTRFGYSVPRQNGKGEILAIRELYGLATGEAVLHTAHLADTSHKAWERLCAILDELGVPYYSIKAKGQEVIEIQNGGRVDFATRTSTGKLGSSYDLLIIDEAQEYTAGQKSALKYVISASKNPQIIMCGTPPTLVSSGTEFKEYRNAVLSGTTKNAAWCEWSVLGKSDPRDVDLWYLTNPSLGQRLTERTIEDEIEDTEDKIIDFNIQRLGLWFQQSLSSAISADDWEKIRTDKLPQLKGKMNIGIKYAKNSETVSLAIAVRTTDGKVFFEVVDSRMVRDGIDWMLDFIIRAKDSINKIVIDGANGQQILADALKKAKINTYMLPSVGQIIKACAGFEKNLYDRQLVRMEQPSLTAVATACAKRNIGSHGGFGYQAQMEAADISLLDAAILATWATDEYPERRPPKYSC